MRASPRCKPRKPAGDMAFIVWILLRVAAGQERFLVKADEEIESNENQNLLHHQTAAPEQNALSGKGDQNTDVHWVSNIAVESAHDKVFRWRRREEGATAPEDKA